MRLDVLICPRFGTLLAAALWLTPSIARADRIQRYAVVSGFVVVEWFDEGDLVFENSAGSRRSELEVTDAELSLRSRNGQLLTLSGWLQTSGLVDFYGSPVQETWPVRVGDFRLNLTGQHLHAVDTYQTQRDLFESSLEVRLSSDLLRFSGAVSAGMSLADLTETRDWAGSVVGRIAGELQLALLEAGDGPEPDPRATLGGPMPGHDVVVCVLHEDGPRPWGAENGVAAYSIATTSGNAGTEDLPWQFDTSLHPLIPQHLYRLKDGRMEQLGMSWLKHGFCALQNPGTCLSGCNCPGCSCMQLLTPGCTDPYSSLRNGGIGGDLGPRWQVNAWTGEFPYPPDEGMSGTLGGRLQVRLHDLDPVLNPQAQYFGEAMYLHYDDAQDGNHYNNASYRPCTIDGFSPGEAPAMNWTGSTQVGEPAIQAWQDVDPAVGKTTVDVPGEGRFLLYHKASDNLDGSWHYEYALFNMNSDRSAARFAVPVPAGVTIAGVGFHDVDYHSGDGPGGVDFDGSDWVATAEDGALTWATTDFGTDPSANALRWGTTYNFRFDANAPPVAADVTIGLFKPGTPDEVVATAVAPDTAEAVLCGPPHFSCDDGISCTDDTCIDGVCVFATNDTLCEDGVACTVQTCSPFAGCVAEPVHALCDDGIACTYDTCDTAAGCQFVPNDALCNDGVACTDDSCDALTGCQFIPNDGSCNDDNDCTEDTCDAVEGCQFETVPGSCLGVELLAFEETDAGADALGLSLCVLIVRFDEPTDRLLSVRFSDITTADPEGFFQHVFGLDTAPMQAFVDLFPDVVYDSFVDIGLRVVPGGGTDTTTFDDDWDSAVFNNGGAVVGGWYNAIPSNDQGLPDEDLQVFIAQLAVRQGYDVSGSMSLFFNDGTSEVAATFNCRACPADLDLDGTVSAADLAVLLGAWGTNIGHPADFNNDNIVNAVDLAALLGTWGPCQEPAP